jgi:hypothetical protein
MVSQCSSGPIAVPLYNRNFDGIPLLSLVEITMSLALNPQSANLIVVCS